MEPAGANGVTLADGRTAAPRLHFEDAMLARFRIDAVDIPLGPHERAVYYYRRRSHDFGGLDGVVTVRQRAGLRFHFGDFRKSS